MALSFKSPLILACIVSIITSKAFKIDKLTILEGSFDAYKKNISLDVSFYRTNNEVFMASFSTKTGSKCLSLDEGFNLFLEAPKATPLSNKFNFALNSGSYYPITDIEYITDDSTLEFVCFLWGSWWPKTANTDSEIQFYINAITKPNNFEKFNVLLFNLVAEGEKLKLGLSIGQNFKKESSVLASCNTFNVDNIEYSVISSNRESYVLKGIKYTHKGDGNLNIFSILDKSYDTEVEDIKNSKDKKLKSSLWKRMICSTDRFEFLAEAAKTDGSEKSGVYILV